MGYSRLRDCARLLAGITDCGSERSNDLVRGYFSLEVCPACRRDGTGRVKLP